MTAKTQLAFFAQYYGQRIMKNRNLDNTINEKVVFHVNFSDHVCRNTNIYYLQLRPNACRYRTQAK